MVFAEALGTVLFRLGRFEEAVEVFEKAPRLREGKSIGFFLAMAYQHLGEHSKALDIYDRTVADQEKLERLTPSQHAIMAEANELFQNASP